MEEFLNKQYEELIKQKSKFLEEKFAFGISTTITDNVIEALRNYNDYSDIIRVCVGSASVIWILFISFLFNNLSELFTILLGLFELTLGGIILLEAGKRADAKRVIEENGFSVEDDRYELRKEKYHYIRLRREKQIDIADCEEKMYILKQVMETGNVELLKENKELYKAYLENEYIEYLKEVESSIPPSVDYRSFTNKSIVPKVYKLENKKRD